MKYWNIMKYLWVVMRHPVQGIGFESTKNGGMQVYAVVHGKHYIIRNFVELGSGISEQITDYGIAKIAMRENRE